MNQALAIVCLVLLGGLFVWKSVFSAWIVALLSLFFLLRGYRQQKRLLQWLDRGGKPPLPRLDYPLSACARLISRQREQSRKRKRRLQRVLSLFRELVNAVPDAAVIVDARGCLVNFNRRAQEILGLERRLDIGVPIDYLLRGEGVDSFWRQMKSRSRFLLRLISSENCWLEFSKVMLAQENVLLIARDVTSEVSLDLKRKAFIDNASHELKTPITVLRGFLEVFARNALPRKLHDPLREMQKHAERMHLLVEDMLCLARLENTGTLIHETEIALRPFLEEVVANANRQYKDSAGAVIGYVEVLTVYADATILRSMVANLIGNALSHADSRHPVELNAARTEQFLLIVVSDDGIGIAPEHIDRITERFYRVDENRAQVKGSGLGLAIVKHGVEAHGGTLTIESQIGVGSNFTMSLPLSRIQSATVPDRD